MTAVENKNTHNKRAFLGYHNELATSCLIYAWALPAHPYNNRLGGSHNLLVV